MLRRPIQSPSPSVRELARLCLQDGDTATCQQITALAHATIAFVEDVLGICDRFRCGVLASAVDLDAPRSGSDILRKDYASVAFSIPPGGPRP
jgi:hypothetical protein